MTEAELAREAGLAALATLMDDDEQEAWQQSFEAEDSTRSEAFVLSIGLAYVHRSDPYAVWLAVSETELLTRRNGAWELRALDRGFTHEHTAIEVLEACWKVDLEDIRAEVKRRGFMQPVTVVPSEHPTSKTAIPLTVTELLQKHGPREPITIHMFNAIRRHVSASACNRAWERFKTRVLGLRLKPLGQVLIEMCLVTCTLDGALVAGGDCDDERIAEAVAHQSTLRIAERDDEDPTVIYLLSEAEAWAEEEFEREAVL